MSNEGNYKVHDLQNACRESDKNSWTLNVNEFQCGHSPHVSEIVHLQHFPLNDHHHEYASLKPY